MSRVRLKLLLGISAAVIAATFFAAPSLLQKKQMAAALYAFGFTPDPAGLPHAKKHKGTFTDISLDADGFSAIGSVTVANKLSGITSIALDRLTLTGELDGWGLPDMTGWEIPSSFQPPRTLKQATLENGQIDLLTPEGAIRLTLAAQMNLAPGNPRKITASLGGEQNQLSLDTYWEATQESGEKPWNAAGEIRNARIAFRNFSASRISGWVNLDGINAATFPQISGQISAGQVQIGQQSAMHNLQLTIDAGPDGTGHLILQGDIAGYDDMHLIADISGISGTPEVAATLETPSLTDLIGFLEAFQADLQTAGIGSSFMTSLLLTPGNLSRLEKQVKRINYDKIELRITGSLYSLNGTLSTVKERNGDLQRSVISLDPG